MNFNKINLETWIRSKTYLHFMNDVPCTYSMCVNIDITKLKTTSKDCNIKLFPLCIYGISNIVNRHQEFRMSLDQDGNVGYFDYSNPCFTLFHKETETFTDVWTEYSDEFHVFYNNYIKDIAIYQNQQQISKPMINDNVFNVSCIPWSSFVGFNLNLQNSYKFLPPIFTIGKYFADGDKILLPLAIQVHHAACDGFHTARFVNELQDWMDHFHYDL